VLVRSNIVTDFNKHEYVLYDTVQSRGVITRQIHVPLLMNNSYLQIKTQLISAIKSLLLPNFGMEMNVENTKVRRISRQTFPGKIMLDQKQLENVESFKYLGSILTNDGRCTCEIKCRIAMAKAAFNKKRTLFTSTLNMELMKKLVKCYI